MADDNLAMDRRLYGHSQAAHELFGWCANCAGHTVRDELEAWRTWAFTGAAEDGQCGRG